MESGKSQHTRAQFITVGLFYLNNGQKIVGLTNWILRLVACQIDRSKLRVIFDKVNFNVDFARAMFTPLKC